MSLSSKYANFYTFHTFYLHIQQIYFYKLKSIKNHILVPYI